MSEPYNAYAELELMEQLKLACQFKLHRLEVPAQLAECLRPEVLDELEVAAGDWK